MTQLGGGAATRCPPVWVGRRAPRQLSRAAYGVSNWLEQHSWRGQHSEDLAPGNQSQNPHHTARMSRERERKREREGERERERGDWT
jgi:glycerol dehydrogenase-like iron-containing ADH family enzyme